MLVLFLEFSINRKSTVSYNHITFPLMLLFWLCIVNGHVWYTRLVPNSGYIVVEVLWWLWLMNVFCLFVSIYYFFIPFFWNIYVVFEVRWSILKRYCGREVNIKIQVAVKYLLAPEDVFLVIFIVFPKLLNWVKKLIYLFD